MTTTQDLDLQQLKGDFDRDGYVVVRQLFLPAEVEEIKETFEQIHRKEFEKSFDDGVRDPNDPLFQFPRVVHPHRFSALARRQMVNPAVVEVLRALFDEEPVAAQSMYYFKPPGARGQAMHQDNMSLIVEPGTCIAAWTAIDRADKENGGMLMVPGSHRGNIVCQKDADITQSFSSTATPIPQGMKPVQVDVEAGDTLFFHGQTIHGSGPNRTRDRFRRAFIGHYAAGTLDRISQFYLPLVDLDGNDCEVAPNESGGACGEGWLGAVH